MGCPKCCRKEEWASNRMPEIPLSIINKQEEEVIKLKNQMILNEKLREMVRQEQEAFRKNVFEKSTEEIYSMAQEIAVKEELAAFFSNTEFSAKEARAMLKGGESNAESRKCPTEYLYGSRVTGNHRRKPPDPCSVGLSEIFNKSRKKPAGCRTLEKVLI